jgi:hypothetical protein
MKMSNINPNNVDMDQAHAIALDHIRPYVERNWSAEQITEGGMWSHHKGYTVQCGGTSRVFDKLHHFNRYRVVVTELNGKECVLQFDVFELIEEIKQPVKQGRLF